MNSQWLLPIVATLVGSFFTYLAVVRRTSGRIATTEADILWEEAATLREVYQQEILNMREEIRVLNSEILALKLENARLQYKLENHASV